MTAGKTKRKGAGEGKVPLAARPWVPYALIVLAGAAAHLWCLGSVYFLDDVLQIRDHTPLREGRWWDGGAFKQWTYFCYYLQIRLWGTSPVGFHAVNWLLHVGVACVLYASGRDYFEGWTGKGSGRGVALGAALLFVSHPLGSEIPNYARTQDLAWVTLFSLLSAWFTLKFLKSGNWRWLPAVMVALAGATFSKGPGFLHAAMMIAVVAAGFLTADHWKRVRARWRLAAAALVAILGTLWLSGVPQWFWRLWATRRDLWSEGWHAVTMSRVFWEFMERFFVPKDFSADHFIATSLAWDPGARWAVAGVVLWTLGATVLLFPGRWRPLGVCLWLTVGAILLRVPYYINEFMPEYRIYPGLPWLCLAVVAVAARGWRRLTRVSPAPLFGLLIAFLCLLSAARSFQWHSLDTLCADILRQYPYQGRALWMLQRRDVERQDWEAVIRRHPRFATITEIFLQTNESLKPTRFLSDGHHLFSEIACRGYYAEALAATGHPRPALAEIAAIKQFLEALKLTEEKFPVHWELYHHAEGRVLEKCGRLNEALAALEKTGGGFTRDLDIARVKRKIAEAASASR